MCERETDGEVSNSDGEIGYPDGEVDHPDGDVDKTFDNIYENIEKIIKEPVAHTWKAAYRQHHYENRHDEFSIENCGFHGESPLHLFYQREHFHGFHHLRAYFNNNIRLVAEKSLACIRYR